MSLASRVARWISIAAGESPIPEGMGQEMDVASEPVDLNNDASYMDTGVLHTGRVCVRCADQTAAKGKTLCADCQEKS